MPSYCTNCQQQTRGKSFCHVCKKDKGIKPDQEAVVNDENIKEIIAQADGTYDIWRYQNR